jgi:hypothetical protein
MEARKHEQRPVMAIEQFPNQDVRVTETFLREHEELLLWLATVVLRAALETPGTVDLDAREALEALIRTHRTLESGLIYETRSPNPYAAHIQRRIQEGVEEYRKHATERAGMHTLRDAEVLGVLVFLQRLELQENNGRKRSRAFIDFLRSHFPVPAEAHTGEQSLVHPA